MASSTFSRTARTNLDLDTLRTLAVAHDRGGLAQAAEHLGRTPSAISLQMKRLQEDLGTPIFRKRGRGLALTGSSRAGTERAGFGLILRPNNRPVESLGLRK